MIVESTEHQYEVGKIVADTGKYRLYLCRQQDTERQCLLQVATDATHNGALDRAAFILTELKRYADELEADYALVREDPNNLLNYHLGFPELVDSFVLHEQGKRQVNILAFRSVDDVSRMVPFANIIDKDRRRVDLRTSGWIMGKILKMFVFTQSVGISIKLVDATNILIEPDQHYVVLFDWSESVVYPETVPEEERREEISHAAQAVIALLAGDCSTRSFPDAERFEPYTDFLLGLAGGSQHNANRAHAEFYALIDGLWKREFYPFHSQPR